MGVCGCVFTSSVQVCIKDHIISNTHCRMFACLPLCVCVRACVITKSVSQFVLSDLCMPDGCVSFYIVSSWFCCRLNVRWAKSFVHRSLPNSKKSATQIWNPSEPNELTRAVRGTSQLTEWPVLMMSYICVSTISSCCPERAAQSGRVWPRIR